jgi:hypothetical protein
MQNQRILRLLLQRTTEKSTKDREDNKKETWVSFFMPLNIV